MDDVKDLEKEIGRLEIKLHEKDAYFSEE